MKPTLEERIMATGQTLERVREWQSIIESIAAKTGEPKEDVASIILRPLATGKVMLADCYKLQEIGVPLSESFMKLVPLSKATSKALLHELTRLGYNREKAKKDLTAAWDYGVKLVAGQLPGREPHAEEAGDPKPLDLAERLTYNAGKAVECLAATSGSSNHETLQALESALWYVQREIKRLGANNEAD